MRGLPCRPIVGRSIGRREGTLRFGSYPISVRMGPRYLAACRATACVSRSGQAGTEDLDHLSQMKGMYNRVLRQDQPDWEAVRHLLGEPDRAVCHLAANWLLELRRLAKTGQSLHVQLAQSIARGIGTAAFQASKALERAGFRDGEQ